MKKTVLEFDFAEIEGQSIVGGIGLGVTKCSDGSTAYDKVLIELDDLSIISVIADQNYDELIVDKYQESARYKSGARIPYIDNLCGSAITWCWVGTNYRGYKDMFTVAFRAIEPALSFVAEAAMVHLYKIERF